jgi:hypothetical protein
MHGSMDGIDLDRSYNIETSLFEAEAQASSPSEQVDSNRSNHPSSRIIYCIGYRKYFQMSIGKLLTILESPLPFSSTAQHPWSRTATM